MKVKRIELPLWKWEGMAVTDCSAAEFTAFARQQIAADIDNVGPTPVGRVVVEADKPWLLWIEDLKDPASLAHEALHVASGVLEARGMRFDRSSEEAYTYTMEHIVRAVLTTGGWE